MFFLPLFLLPLLTSCGTLTKEPPVVTKVQRELPPPYLTADCYITPPSVLHNGADMLDLILDLYRDLSVCNGDKQDLRKWAGGVER